ncbi:uncharacterized protein DFL_004484 [Arthrobotrys flagrans]|uniref:Peptidase S8/S53 domain-containing protein n=1 Tax=Arthrobotrys flagrans TaxID=97331 RepID=A0A437A524_ARTFL|nr:hypothetical protein DFL_004484 [Arthrobotrys flagrans]
MKYSLLISTSILLGTFSTTLAAPVNPIAASSDDTDEYIVVLAPTEKRPWGQVFTDMGYNMTSRAHSISVNKHTFGTNYGDLRTFGKEFRAFTTHMKSTDAASLASLPNVLSIEKDVKWTVKVQRYNDTSFGTHSLKDDKWSFPVVKRQQQDQLGQVVQQSTAPWNLARISTAQPLTSNGRQVIDLKFNYQFERSSGLGVDVYMLDSGINTEHADFGGRAKMVFTAFGNDATDGHGHGTHTAGTVGSTTFGVAKNVNLLGVKVLDTQNGGSLSNFVAGVDFALSSHLQRRGQPGFKGSIINMSLGGPGFAQPLFEALQRATQAGMHVAVAGGNDNTDSCQFSPAQFSQLLPIINVGATNVVDQRWEQSNFGKCIDIYAPGDGIVSTSNKGPQAMEPMSGTSMACPAVAGAMAVELFKNPGLDPASLKKLIVGKALNGVLTGVSGQNALLNNGLRAVG